MEQIDSIYFIIMKQFMNSLKCRHEKCSNKVEPWIIINNGISPYCTDCLRTLYDWVAQKHKRMLCINVVRGTCQSMVSDWHPQNLTEEIAGAGHPNFNLDRSGRMFVHLVCYRCYASKRAILQRINEESVQEEIKNCRKRLEHYEKMAEKLNSKRSRITNQDQ